MITQQKRLSTYVLSLLENGHGAKQIETYLEEHGHDVKFVKEVVRETVKLRRSQRMIKLLALVLAGAVICLVCAMVVDTEVFSHNLVVDAK